MRSLRLTPSIVATDVTRGYGSGATRRTILENLSLQFMPRELCLITGVSGSGKSTLLATLSGLLAPEAGEVTVLGTTISTLTASSLAAFRFRHFGFIFQGFNLFAGLSALEQVAMPLRFGNVANRDALERARAALDEVGLSAHGYLLPAQLSGGEKQRVAIARALAGNPQVLFADEPTSALDGANSAVVMTLLKSVAEHKGATVIVVTHDTRLRTHAHRLIELQDGAVVSDALMSASTSGAAVSAIAQRYWA